MTDPRKAILIEDPVLMGLAQEVLNDLINDGTARVIELPNAVTLAMRFHEHYERLAPIFGYQTRPESAVPWSDVPDSNKNLMVAVAEELLSEWEDA